MNSANPLALGSRLLLLLSSLFLAISACDKFTLPRFWQDEPIQQVPASVTLAFEQAFLDSILTVDACGQDYDVKTGEVLAETFVEMSQESFATVTVQRGTQTPQSAPTTVANQLALTITSG